jgi:hypothetical protein
MRLYCHPEYRQKRTTKTNKRNVPYHPAGPLIRSDFTAAVLRSTAELDKQVPIRRRTAQSLDLKTSTGLS